MQRDLLDEPWSFAQMFAQLPVTAFSVMELDLKTEGHAFGPLMLHLLGIRPDIQRLKVVLARNKVITYSCCGLVDVHRKSP